MSKNKLYLIDAWHTVLSRLFIKLGFWNCNFSMPVTKTFSVDSAGYPLGSVKVFGCDIYAADRSGVYVIHVGKGFKSEMNNKAKVLDRFDRSRG